MFQRSLLMLAFTGLLFAADTPPTKSIPEWDKAESAFLTNIRQLTSDFVRAGESYFSPDGTKIIFQAEEKGTGNPFYQIFVQDLKTGSYRKVSPGMGRTTCGYFAPDRPRILFASSHLDPEAKKVQEGEVRQREEDKKTGKRRRYSWDFDPYMSIFESDLDGSNLKNLTPDIKGYNAEGSFSADGKQIVFCSNRDGHLQLYIMDADGKNVRKLTDTPNCYNGGPFFSPDGKKVIFRSDRKEKDRLQLYVIDADGKNEKALTSDDKWVYWAPYWYPDGKHIVYTAADHSDETTRPNYELYWLDLKSKATTRLTFAPGQDVLPVFSPDGKRLMWTSSRDGRSPTQIYIADFTAPKD